MSEQRDKRSAPVRLKTVEDEFDYEARETLPGPQKYEDLVALAQTNDPPEWMLLGPVDDATDD